jgi:hypothetical protein
VAAGHLSMNARAQRREYTSVYEVDPDISDRGAAEDV